MLNRFGSILFAAVLAAELLAIGFGWMSLHVVTKPLLVPILLLGWVQAAIAAKGWSVPLALFFSWLGDILLIGDESQPAWFMGGIAAFLLAHVCYILFFMRIRRHAEHPSGIRALPLLLTVMYVSFLLWLLLPRTGALKIPVLVYACVIGTMLLTVIHAFAPGDGIARTYSLAGALLFVLSDSVLAINKFYQPFAGAGLMVMLTYGLAQFALVKGALLYLSGNNLRKPTATA